MTISSTTRKAGPFFGNGATVDYPFPFKVFKKQDLLVTLTDTSGADTPLVLDSQYSATLNSDQDANPGGTVRYPVSGDPLPSGWRLTITGALPNTQPTDIQNNGGFYPQVVEDMGDRSTIQIQQLQEVVDRSLKFSVSDPGVGAVLPPADLRANKVLAFDQNGTPITAVPVDGNAAAVAIALQNFINSVASTSGAGLVGWRQRGAGSIATTVRDKLYQVVDARDFGAVVDPSIDSTSAVELMRTASNDTKSPAMVPAAVSHTLNLAGTERVQTRYSVPWETERLGECANAMYLGQTVRIDCFGDSTMWGAQVGNLNNQSPSHSPGRLQEILRRYYNNTAAQVMNRGISATSVAQMLAGTDGSGQTFEARIAESSAAIVYCNHCINSVNSDIVVYKRDIQRVVDIVRKYGKVPVLCTPNPNPPVDISDLSRNERLKAFADVMRQVARDGNVALVDNYVFAQKAMASGAWKATEIVGDGVHPTDAWYAYFGQNFAIPLIQPRGGLSLGSQYLYAADDGCLVSNTTPGAQGAETPRSITGIGKLTPTTGAQSVSMAVVIEDSGMDFYMAHPVWGDGSSDLFVRWDLAVVDQHFSMRANDYGSLFVQDYETRVASGRQTAPGLHLLELITTTSTGGLGLYYGRVRPSLTSRAIFNGTPAFVYRKRWLTNFDFVASAAGDVMVLPDYPTSRLDRPLVLEFKAQLPKLGGVVLCGGMAANLSTTSAACANIVVGLGANGYLNVWEGGGATNTTLGSVDLSTAPHTFSIETTTGGLGTIKVSVDGVLVGTHAFTRPYFGGFLGLWAGAPAAMHIDQLDYVDRL